MLVPRLRVLTVALALCLVGITVPARGAGGSTPKQILLVRHAEKPDDDQDIHLTSRGAARAAALPSLFVIPPTFPSKPASFATPDFIFATKESKHSNRPVETVAPLAKALNDMTIHQKDSNDEYAKLAVKIFEKDKYANKTILICWHHGTMPELTQAIIAHAKNGPSLKNQVPKHWKDAVFDRVWIVTFESSGNAAFADVPQRLLFGDSKK